MDIQYFDKLWETKRTSMSADKEFWDSRAREFNDRRTDKRLSVIVELLIDKGMLTTGSEVLDIGCGPGRYAMEFAKRAKKVIGLDISSNMIRYARANAEKNRVDNTEFYELPWQEVNLQDLEWNKRFSLVTAIMSPAIDNRQSLEKMMAASSQWCFMAGFAERTDSVKDEIEKHIFNKKDKNREFGKGLYCTFNILWNYGIYPDVTCFDVIFENMRTLDQAYDYYCAALQRREALSEMKKQQVRNYLQTIAQDGMVKEIMNSKIMWMYWKNK